MKKTSLVLFIITILLQNLIFSVNYEDNFPSGGIDAYNVWTRQKLGREGVFVGTGAITITNNLANQLVITSDAVGAIAQEGPWMGWGCIMTNNYFTATPLNPFGYQITKISIVDNGGYGSDPRDTTATYCMIGETNNLTWITAGESLKNFITIQEEARPQAADFSKWGFSQGASVYFDFANAKRADGSTINLTTATHLWGFDYSGNNAANNDKVGIMMTHLGDRVQFFLNPDVGNAYPAFPNEYCYVGERSVAFNSNLFIALGIEKRTTAPEVTLTMDKLIIRPAVSGFNIQSVTSPEYSTGAGDTRSMVFIITNTINNNQDAGINVVKLVKASGWSAWDTNALIVQANSQTLNLVSYETYTNTALSNRTIGQAQYTARVDGTTLWLRLGNQIMSNTANKTITVTADLETPPSVATTYSFKAIVNAVLFDPAINNQSTNTFATCGEHTVNFDVVVTAPAGAVTAAGEIRAGSGNVFYQGYGPYAASYYIQGFAANGTDTIKSIVIDIPDKFSNCFIYNIDSLYNITSAKYTTVANLATNVIEIDYTGSGLSKDGIDVITFTISNKTGNPPVLGENIEWRSWVDSSTTADSNSTPVIWNVDYSNKMTSVTNLTPSYTWDFQIINGVNYAPLSIGVSNEIVFAYFDIFREGQALTEVLTNCTIGMYGKNADIAGELFFYRDTNDNTTFGTEKLLDNTLFASGEMTKNFYFTDSNQSTSAGSPTRYWVTLKITNSDPNIYTNTVNVKITKLRGNGPNSGTFENTNNLTSPINKTARIDTHLMYMTTWTLLSNKVKQSSYTNPAFKIVLSNADPDATNYFSFMQGTNEGTANNGDMGYFTLFQDLNRNDQFDAADVNRLAGTMTAKKIYNATAVNPVVITGLSNFTFWGTFDVNLSAQATKTISLKVLTNTNMFSSLYHKVDHSDSSPLIKSLSGNFPVPGTVLTNKIIPFAAQPFDYYMKNIVYDIAPQSITTNEYASIGYFEIFTDKEETNYQEFTGLAGNLTSVNTKTNISGIIYIFKEKVNSGFKASDDTLIASNFIVNGNPFAISCAISNLSSSELNPEKFYLVFRLTNAIENALTNTVKFKITNLYCTGPDNGVFTNLGDLATSSSREIRADSGKVLVAYLSNQVTNYNPKMGSFNNPFLTLGLTNEDPDTTNYLSYINIKTNSLHTAANTHLASVKLYWDTNGRFDGPSEPVKSVQTIAVDGTAQLSLSIPLAISGTNLLRLYIGYDLSSDDENAVGKYVGFMIPAGGIGFVDNISDNHPQNGYITGTLPAPVGGNETNITIAPLTAQTWDYKVLSTANYGPVSMSLSNEFTMYYFDVQRDGQNINTEAMTNCVVRIMGAAGDIQGRIKLYKDTNNRLSFNNELLVTSKSFSNSTVPHILSFFESNQSVDSVNPTRYWVTLEITNRNSRIFSNRVRVAVTNIKVKGPDTGVVKDGFELTNIAASLTMVDDYKLFISATTMLSNKVAQGAFNNLAMKIIITNSDPDATNYLSELRITNYGTADNGDMGSFMIYEDNGDNVFNNNLDTLVGIADMTAQKYYKVSFNPVVALTNAPNVFWGVFNVKFESQNYKTMTFGIPAVNDVNNVKTVDNISDSYSLIPKVITSGSLPAALTTNRTIPFTSKAYDYSLSSINYNSMPQSFTTNEDIAVSEIYIFADTEDTNSQEFTGLAVNLTTLTAKNNVSGIAYLYHETQFSDFYAASNDTLIASNFIAGGSPFTINCAISNLSSDQLNPEKFYLVYRQTNTSQKAYSNTIKFQITNLYCDGPNNGIFTNIGSLSTKSSRMARIDSGKVVIAYLSNNVTNYNPKMGSFNNSFLTVGLTNEDPDATNYLTYIKIRTNSLHTASAAHLASVKLYWDTNGRFDGPAETVKSVQNLAADGTAQLNLSTPLTIIGTNLLSLYIGYDLSSDDDNAIGKLVGFMLPADGFGFVDNINDNYNQNAYIKGTLPAPISPNETNITIAPLTSQLWDYKVISADNTGPVSMTLSNEFTMYYFDVQRDGQNVNTEAMTNCAVRIIGASGDIQGRIKLYKDTNNRLTFNNELLVTSKAFSNSTITHILSFYESNQSVDSVNPTRYWLTLEITNRNPLIFSNRVRIAVTNIKVKGPDAGVVFDRPELTNVPGNMTMVDDYKLFISATTLLTNKVAQGAFNNIAMKIIITNSDPDATNYLSELRVTNYGTANNTDLGSFMIYRDDGDNIFSNNVDTLAGIADMTAQNYYKISFNPNVALTYPSNIFWGIFNVKFESANYKTMTFQILNVNDNNNVKTADNISDSYSLIPRVITTGNLPATLTTNRTIPFTSKAYDYSLSSINYNSMPQSFTTNEYVAVSEFNIFADSEDTNSQEFTGLAVNLTSSGTKNNVSGIAYIYQETLSNNSFGAGVDTLIASNFVVNGNPFTINCAISNLTADQLNPDKFYLIFKLTNNIVSAYKDTIKFQITNLYCSGPDGGIFTNLGDLSTTSSREARIDSGKVILAYLSNNVTNAIPIQGSFNNAFLALGLTNIDPDVTNYLSYIDVKTNGLTTTINTHIASVKLYQDNNGVFEGASESLQSIQSITASGTSRLQLGTPLPVIGTNLLRLYIGYDLSSDDDTAIGKTFGLFVENNGIGFSDQINDNFTQNAYISGTLPAPVGANETNITISPLTARTWDFKLVSAKNTGPVSMNISNMYSMYYFDVVRDGQNDFTEKITNIKVVFAGSAPDIQGSIYLYEDTNDVDTLGNDKYITNIYFTNTSTTNFILINELGQSKEASTPTRYWLGLKITNNNPLIYNDRLSLKAVDIDFNGPNSGNVVQESKLTNVSAKLTMVDDYRIFISAQSRLTNKVKQGSFNNTALKITITNSDPDATNYLYKLTVTNRGSANASDLGNFLVYRDNGDNVFSNASDSLVGIADMNSKNAYVIEFNPYLALTYPSNVFWGNFNVEFSAQVENSMTFQILEVSDTNNVNPIDNISDLYTLIPDVRSSGNHPTALTTNKIIPFNSKEYDFYAASVSYTTMPQSFTTNQQITIGKVTLFGDEENTNTQSLNFMDVATFTTGTKNNVSGWAYVYKETNGDGIYSTNHDQLIGSNAVSCNADFAVPLNYSNITANLENPDTLYLVFMLTNDIDLAKPDKLSFQISNFRCSGPNKGVVTNAHILTNKKSIESRIDKRNVIVNYIENNAVPPNPSQSSFNNKIVKISLRGDDPDVRHFIKSIVVMTNNLSTVNVADDHIPYIKIVDSSDDLLKGAKFNAGSNTIVFVQPYEMIGSNEVILYVSYDVTGSVNVVGSKFGIKIPNNAIAFMDNIDDNFPQVSYITNNYTGPTNETYVNIQGFNYIPWDFNLYGYGSTAPASIKTNQLYGMTYFDIQSDKQDPKGQVLTNITVMIQGAAGNLAGDLYLYRDSNNISQFSPANDFFLTNVSFTPGTTTKKITFVASNMGFLGEITNYTRFWVGMKITNTGSSLLTNSVMIKVTAIAGKGPDSGNFTNLSVTNQSHINNYTTYARSRVDSHSIWISTTAMSNGANFRQGTFNNPAFKLVFFSDDVDATNYLKHIKITNAGTDYQDLEDFRLYRDDGDGIFIHTNDKLELTGSIGNNNKYEITPNTPIALSNSSNVFWAVYGVKLTAGVANTISLFIPNITSNLVFSDEYSEPMIENGYSQIPTWTNAGQHPAAPSSQIVGSLYQQPYDFYLLNTTYHLTPHSITTNEIAPIGQFDIFRDVDNNTLYFKGIDIDISTTKQANNINGWSYLYKDQGDGQFSATNDSLIASNAITSGGDFSINCNYTGVTLDQYNPSRFYLAVKVTSSIDTVKNDSMKIQITNIRCSNSGTGNGIFTNLVQLTNISREIRVDKGLVKIIYISNFISNYFPKQGSFNNTMTKIVLQGDDEDARHYLSYIKVTNNNGTTILDAHIPSIKLFLDNGDQTFSDDTDVQRAIKPLSGGQAKLDISPVLELSGTNKYTFFIAYDIASDDDNAIAKKFGIEIKNYSMGFSDNINDSFNQRSFVLTNPSGILGPAINTSTNVTVSPLTSRNWDFKVMDINNTPPTSIKTSNVFALAYMDIVRDGQSLELEKLTNIKFLYTGLNAEAKGILSIYRDDNPSNKLWTNSSVSSLLTNISIINPKATNTITINQTNLKTDQLQPTRLWFAINLTNTDNNIFSNTVGIKVLDISGNGPNDGLIINKTKISDQVNKYARVDDYNVYINYVEYTNGAPAGYNTLVKKFIFSNSDPDAVYSLKSMIIAKGGNYTNGDLKTFKISLDNGDNDFNLANDDIIAFDSTLSTSNTYNLIMATPVNFSLLSNNTFWANVDVEVGAGANHMKFSITNLPNNVVFVDPFSDNYTLLPTIQTSFPVPVSIVTQLIVPYQAAPYDFTLDTLSYDQTPVYTSTNQEFIVGSFSFRQDIQSGIHTFDGIAVDIDSTNTAPNLSGTVYLYEKTNNAATFVPSKNKLLTNLSIINASDFVITITNTNALKSLIPQQYFITMIITNDITSIKDTTMNFKITNLFCNGPNGGIFTNLYKYAAVKSSDIRIDDPWVTIVYISNDIVHFEPTLNSRKNPYLRIGIRGNDIDSIHYFSYLDVITNILSTINSASIANVRLYSGKSSDFQLETPIGYGENFTTMSERIDMTTPFQIKSTNLYTLYVGYDIGSDTNTIQKQFGLTITNNSFGFIDYVNDSLSQKTFVNGVASGPSTNKNVKIFEEGARWWDVYIQRIDKENPSQAIANVEVPILSFDGLRENPMGTYAESITAVRVQSLLNSKSYSGTLKLYTNSFLSRSYNGGIQIASGAISSSTPSNTLTFASNYLAHYGYEDPIRFYLTFTPNAGFASDAEVAFKIASVDAHGLNGGKVANSNYFIDYPTYKMQLEDNSVTFNLTATLTNLVVQGQSKVPAITLSIKANDANASYTLNNLTFGITGTRANSNISGAELYSDSGSAGGTWDKNDLAYDGASGSFNNGKLSTAFKTPLTITSTPIVMHLLVNISGDATAGDKFAVTCLKSDQTGLSSINILNTSYAVSINDYSPQTTSECTIDYDIIFEAAQPIAAAHTFVDVANGEKCAIYFKNEYDTTKYQAFVYDALGFFIKELEIKDQKVEWDGKMRVKDDLVNTGLYLIIIKGPDFEKVVKVMILK